MTHDRPPIVIEMCKLLFFRITSLGCFPSSYWEATATSFKPGTLTLASFLLDDPHQWREDVESGRLGILRKVQRH
jgi:hypothetical protein